MTPAADSGRLPPPVVAADLCGLLAVAPQLFDDEAQVMHEDLPALGYGNTTNNAKPVSRVLQPANVVHWCCTLYGQEPE